ncbi:hypothetical protein MLD38_020226 [Melastoma candidum]|uniref:Uncharacterized protein n=1 Tax=Melastoma candidum TaxID=119954 RepID=A0ACB9QDI1_9MYRT|nr:hypothetical protein MLD38_020226 [Melastoma candidum]
MARSAEPASSSPAQTGMLVPLFVNCLNLGGGLHPLEAGHVSLRLDISFHDFLSQMEQNLVDAFTYSRRVRVVAIDNVEYFGSTGSFETRVYEGFNFSRIVEYRKRCHFVVDVVVVDMSWDRYRGDPEIEFEPLREWKEW